MHLDTEDYGKCITISIMCHIINRQILQFVPEYNGRGPGGIVSHHVPVDVQQTFQYHGDFSAPFIAFPSHFTVIAITVD